MQIEPLISVIMNCHNGESFLNEAIESVINQKYKNWELIFWDNASNDKSAEICKEYNDSRIKYYFNKELDSLGRARNLALQKASGGYIAFLDVDDVWLPEKLSMQVEFMLLNNNAVLCYTDGCYIYENKISKLNFSKEEKTFEGFVLKELLQHNFINIPTILINKELAGKELLFNEAFSFCEEYELYLRLSQLGRFIYLNKILAYYRVHSNNASKNLTLAFNEHKIIWNIYSDKLKEYNIDTKTKIVNYYRGLVLDLIAQGKKEEAKKYSHYLIKHRDFRNVGIFIFLKLKFYKLLSPGFLLFVHKIIISIKPR